jgi:cell division protein FtsW
MQKGRSIDFSILILTIALVLFGIVMVFSASFYYAEQRYHDQYFFFKKQIIGAVVGLACMLFLTFFDYKKMAKFRYPMLIISIALLGAVLVPGVGQKLNGSARWIPLPGFNLQPVEVVKLALIVFMAANMAGKKEKMKKFKFGVFPYLLIMGIICGLLLLQPNFSAVISIVLLTFILMFVGGANILHLGVIGGSGAAALYLLLFTQDYRQNRILAFLDPWKYPQEQGYQLIQSLYAIGSGGLFGVGFGNSRQKFLFLPYGESDFIFSIITEELGFIGAVCVIAVFALLIWRGIRVAMRAPDMFGTLVAGGIVSIIAIQVLMNIAVVTGTIPPTGVSLPFLSHGSSSLVIFMSSIGVLLNISKQCNTA